MTGNRDSRIPPPRVGRDRRHLYPGRARAVNARFTDGEYAELVAAAELADLTPTGFCAQAALDVARALHVLAARADNRALATLQAELFHVRVTLNQLCAELNLARVGQQASPQGLDKAIARAVHAVADVDNVITRIDRQLKAPRSTSPPTDPGPAA